MANVVHRQNVEFRRSVNSPDYSEMDWIIGPDLSLLISPTGFLVPHKYWKVVGDTVIEMNPEEKAVVDANNPVQPELPPNTSIISFINTEPAGSGTLFRIGGNIFYRPVVKTKIVALKFVSEDNATGVINFYKNGDFSSSILPLTLTNENQKSVLNLNLILENTDSLYVMVSEGAIQSASLLLYQV